jgi:hypothetical protein
LKPCRSRDSHEVPGLDGEVLLADAAVARDEVEAEPAEVAGLHVAELARDEVVVEEPHAPIVLAAAALPPRPRPRRNT